MRRDGSCRHCSKCNSDDECDSEVNRLKVNKLKAKYIKSKTILLLTNPKKLLY